MAVIKAIIFDIGGVVTFTDFQALYANFASRIGIAPEVVSQYHKEHWNDLLLADISLEQFFQDIKIAGANPDLDLKDVWLQEALKIRKVNTELLEIIAKLKEHYIVGVLSNLTLTRLMVDEYLHLYDHFNFVLLSCKDHLKKPDPKFYELALKKANANPAEAVFIDDNERNTMAARELGLKDVLYIDNQKLLEDLKLLDVIV